MIDDIHVSWVVVVKFHIEHGIGCRDLCIILKRFDNRAISYGQTTFHDTSTDGYFWMNFLYYSKPLKLK